ncbi:MAG: hypothetical protein IJG42_01535 [Muribaculaceae bacterium]|nr:hypothetical protein [Muribaculaceae bacterium]
MNDQINDAGAVLAQLANRPSDSMTPFLVFGDEAGNPINEITLAPGEERNIQVILYKHPEAITRAFQAQWLMYGSNHEKTAEVTCKKDSDEWIFPLGLSTMNKSEGGMYGNFLNSRESEPSLWRCIAANIKNNQFWYPRDKFTTPTAVAEFTIVAASNWSDSFATFELDTQYTEFALATDPDARQTIEKCDYDMVLTIKNSSPNAKPVTDNNDGETTPPPQDNNDGDNAPDGPITEFEGERLLSRVGLDIRTMIYSQLQPIPNLSKHFRVKFIFDTFRLQKDANGKYVKVPGRTHVVQEIEGGQFSNANKLDSFLLSLKEGEYLENNAVSMIPYYKLERYWRLCRGCYGLVKASPRGAIMVKFSGLVYSLKVASQNQEIFLEPLPAPILDEVMREEEIVTAQLKKEEEEFKKRQEEERKRKEEEERKRKEEEERKRKEEEERKRKEEEERKRREEEEKRKKMINLNNMINSYPMINVEDGYAIPPTIHQSASETGAWVRGSRGTKSGIWFMLGEEMNGQLIYPGNVILVDKDQKFTKNMVEIPFNGPERKPLRFDAKYSNEMPNDSTVLNSFTRADVNIFVNKCLTNYKNGSHDLPSNSTWQIERSERKEGISLGGTIKGVSFDLNASRNKTVTVAYLKQEMYTISLNNEYSDASEIFTDKVDIDKFRRNIDKNPGGIPAIIDAVKYGRIISLWAYQEGNEPATLNVDKYFKLTVTNTNKTTRYFLRVYGGVAGDTKLEFSNYDSVDAVQNVLNQLKEVSRSAMETALPMEYSVKFLRNLTTNVQWKVLPYYKTYLPQVKFRVIKNFPGTIGTKCAVYLLDYVPRGNKLDYCKSQVDKKKMDYEFYCSPKALCIDIKFDLVAMDKHDYNVMLPCIPYDSLQPDEKGEFVFKVFMCGSVVGDKNAKSEPIVPGLILSTSNKYFMNNKDKLSDSPMLRFDCAGATEERILNYYITWAGQLVRNHKELKFIYSLDRYSQLRPNYD